MRVAILFLGLLITMQVKAQNKWFLSAQAGLTRQYTVLRGDEYAIENSPTASEKFQVNLQLQSKESWHYQIAIGRLTYWSPSSFFGHRFYWDLGKSYQLAVLIGKPIFERKKSSLSVLAGLNVASLFGDFNSNSKGGGYQISDQYALYYSHKEKAKNLINILLQINLQYNVKISQSMYLTFNSSGLIGLNKMVDNYFEYQIIENGSETTYHSIIANYGTHLDLMIGLKYHINNKTDIFIEPE